MKKIVLIVVTVLCCVFAFTACGSTKTAETGETEIIQGKAEKLYLGNFTTMEDVKPFAKALTVIGDKIQYVGSVETAKSLCDENTEIIDFGDKYIYPGFLDSHTHGMFAGYRAIGQANVSQVIPSNEEKYREIIKDFIEKNPDKEIYLVAGWIEDGVANFTSAFLDEICPDKPLMLNSAGGHSLLLNSAAMKKYGITAEYAKEIGTDLVRVDENGEPTGYLCEGPAVKIATTMPISLEEAKDYVQWWQDFAFSSGFTGASDAGVDLLSPNAYQAYVDLEKEGKLKLYTGAYIIVPDNGGDSKSNLEKMLAELTLGWEDNGSWSDYNFEFSDEDLAWLFGDDADNTDFIKAHVEKIAELAEKDNSQHFTIVGPKVFLDGVGEAHTAWLTEEYDDQPGYFGNQRFNDPEKMTELIAESAKHGLAVHAHSDGDGATKFFLDCIEAAQAQTGIMDQRNAFAHLEFVRAEDIQRIADTNSVAVVPPTWSPSLTGVYDREIKEVGAERAATKYPIKSFFDAGADVVFHSDYPVSPDFNVPASIYTAVTRSLPESLSPQYGGPKSVRGLAEAITRKQTLLAMTKNVAYMWHQEDMLGSLAVGKIANMTIMDTDLLNEDIEKIPLAKVVATVVDGEIVYQAK